MKTVIDAVKELKGELNGAAGVCYPEDSYLFYALDGSHYIFDECKDTDGVYQYVCTRKEFLATVAECETNFGECDINTVSAYLIALCDGDTTELEPTKDLDKELDVDIDWGTTEYNFALVNSLNNIVEFLEFKPRLTDDNECYTTNVTEKLYYVGPWAVAERTQPILPTLTYTQAMYDNGVQVEAGMRFATEAGEYIAEYTNKKSVVFTDEDGFLITVTRRRAKPIDIRTDKEKAIDDMYKSLNKDDSRQGGCDDLFDDIKAGKIHGVSFQPLTVEVK
jgi:hypothetical protein